MNRRKFIKAASGLFVAAAPTILKDHLAEAAFFQGGVARTSSAPPVINIPLSKSDPIFSGNTPTTGGAGVGYTVGTQSKKNWDNSPSYPSGDSVWYFDGDGSQQVTISQCIIDWREGPRLSGWNGATLNIDQCYINCVGKTGDHADAIQAFVSGGQTGNLNLTNTCVQAYTTSEAVAKYGAGFVESTCLQWGDQYQGTINYSNVCLISGAPTVNLGADTGTTTIIWNDVYVVNSGGLTIVAAGGNLVIGAWNNVRNATIVGNSIVPGTLITAPA